MAPARRAGDNAMNAAGHPLDRYDWTRILGQLDAEGWAPLPALFDPPQARARAQAFGDPAAVRTGGERDERRALRLPAPPLLRDLPRALYARLAPLAQSWAQRLGRDIRYPPDPDAGRAAPHAEPAALTRLRLDGHEALRHAHDDTAFPILLVALLSDPAHDFSGGEFVMTEQRPRQQSRPLVLPLGLGDATLIACAHRPIRGARDDYRATLRHAVSRVRDGERRGLELPLDAPRSVPG
ncbi:2OG-Fe(II) oxygenase [Achromobacter insuavis]|uniref:2OG-Fe(II) oxygenase n=1 Tax=Achromobacter insuavis TaxID=1287735 RepID=UPI0035A0EF87